MVASIARTRWNTLKTEKNFNNQLGVPLTLFRLEPDMRPRSSRDGRVALATCAAGRHGAADSHALLRSSATRIWSFCMTAAASCRKRPPCSRHHAGRRRRLPATGTTTCCVRHDSPPAQGMHSGLAGCDVRAVVTCATSATRAAPARSSRVRGASRCVFPPTGSTWSMRRSRVRLSASKYGLDG